MYEELLTDLKHCGSALSCRDCRIKCSAGCVETLMNRAADAIEELQAAKCPHYIRNVHDRGDDSLCNKFECEVAALPKSGPMLKGG